uniref:GRF-type domain-containing protein n=1 Tax=Hordeum vulgare subsp. vulgare TaxID=112509 RepID=A0A8I6Z2B6_HORVV
MSTSSATHSKWRQCGPVPLTRCPGCPRPEPLKWWVSKTDDNDNLGREFVKCSSKTMTGRDDKILKKCTHFEWMDNYIERFRFKGYIDSSGTATWEINLGGEPPIAVKNLGSSDTRPGRVLPMARYPRNAELYTESELNEELRKIKKHLMHMIDLQKQPNIMGVGFYSCFIA